MTAMTLYILLRHVHKTVARVMVGFVALAVGIILAGDMRARAHS